MAKIPGHKKIHTLKITHERQLFSVDIFMKTSGHSPKGYRMVCEALSFNVPFETLDLRQVEILARQQVESCCKTPWEPWLAVSLYTKKETLRKAGKSDEETETEAGFSFEVILRTDIGTSLERWRETDSLVPGEDGKFRTSRDIREGVPYGWDNLGEVVEDNRYGVRRQGNLLLPYSSETLKRLVAVRNHFEEQNLGIFASLVKAIKK